MEAIKGPRIAQEVRVPESGRKKSGGRQGIRRAGMTSGIPRGNQKGGNQRPSGPE